MILMSDNSVQSIERALDIIEVIAVSPRGKTLTEVAKAVDLHKSTAHRLLSTLQARGYVKRSDDGVYRVGLKLVEAVSFHINNLELQTEARPFIAKITATLGLTAHLGVLDEDKVVYIEKMDTISNPKLYSQIGLRSYSYCSSLGKCLLSNYSKEELYHILKDCSFIKFTPKTISNVEELYRELQQVRMQGFAIDDEEHEKGHRCIGAPIYDYRGDIIAALSASGDIRILTDDRISEVAQYVKDVANELSHIMGYTG